MMQLMKYANPFKEILRNGKGYTKIVPSSTYGYQG